MKIYSPVGNTGTPPRVLASSLATLRGARLGVLANNKPHADTLLEAAAGQIADRSGAQVVCVKTKNAALPAEAETITELSKEVQAVLTGSAD